MNWRIRRIIQWVPNAIKSSYLCIRFPFLQHKNYDGKRSQIIPTFSWYTSIPYGWRKSFGIQMCKELKDALKRHNMLHSYRILDIKEKYGRLEIDDCGAASEIHDILAKYEYISERTCIVCGRRAKYVTSGWECPYCEDCIKDTYKNGTYEFYTDINWYGYTSIKFKDKTE